MRNNDKTITVYYNPDARIGSEVVVYARSITDNVNEVDITMNPLTQTQIIEIFGKIDRNINPLDLVDIQSDVYQNEFKDKVFDTVNWAQILSKRPELFHYPIAVMGDRARICRIPDDVEEFYNWQSQERHN